MKRLGLALAFCLMLIGSSFAQGGMGPGPGTVHSTGGSTTTFDPSNTTAQVVLSGGNLIATGQNATATASRGTRGIASHSTSGLYYAEFTLTTADTSNASIGLVNASFVVGTTNLGTTNDASWFESSGCLVGGATCNMTGIGNPGLPTYTTGDVISLAVDLDHSKIWWRKNAGNWNNQATGDPATNTRGVDISAVTGGSVGGAGVNTVYVYGGMQRQGVWTANYGATAYAQSVPSGFGNW